MKKHANRQQGFTAVELLVTLFIAAAFLISGYQLFNAVINDGGSARAESRASNAAYEYLRKYADSASNPCAPSTPVANQPITVDGLDTPILIVTVTCPRADLTTLSRVEAIISYGTAPNINSVRHATFVDKTTGTISLEASPILAFAQRGY